MVDWSASSVPKLGADSIWFCIVDACKTSRCQSNILQPSGPGRPQLKSDVAKHWAVAEQKKKVNGVAGRKRCRGSRMDKIMLPNTESSSTELSKSDCESLGEAWQASRGIETLFTVRCVENVATRSGVESVLVNQLIQLVKEGRRVLLGFDFSLGFSTGFAAALDSAVRKLDQNVSSKPGCKLEVEMELADLEPSKDRVCKEQDSSSKETGGQLLDCSCSITARAPSELPEVAAELTPARTSTRVRQSVRLKRRSLRIQEGSARLAAGGTDEMSDLSVRSDAPKESMKDPAVASSNELHVKRGRHWPLEAGWVQVWQHLHEHIVDNDNNSNNRFQVAAKLNEVVSKAPYPFWGCPPSRASPFLLPNKQPPPPHLVPFPEKREAESWCSAQSTWKLYTTGSVGSQTLLGIPRVFNIRHHPLLRRCARVWPFETGFRPPSTSGPSDVAAGAYVPSIQPQSSSEVSEELIVIAEVYPSLVPPDSAPGEPKDAGQVRALASHFAALDAQGQLAGLFLGPLSKLGAENVKAAASSQKLDPAGLEKSIGYRAKRSSDADASFNMDMMVKEEGWILGIV